MTSTLMKDKDRWLNEDFMKKIMAKPQLMAAFSDPQFSVVLAEMQKDPKAAAMKYGQNPKFRELMQEFSGLMANHFTEVADKQKKEEEEAKRKQEEEMKKDPVYQTI